MPLYFAFGSNLDPAQLADREVEFQRPRHAILHDWKLVFNKVATLNAVPGEGRANIVPARRRIVEGVVFDVTDDGLANLDWYEGAASGHYKRTTIQVELPDTGAAEAETYIAKRIRPGLKPSPWYVRRIVTGARYFHLSEAYITALEGLPTVGPHEKPEK